MLPTPKPQHISSYLSHKYCRSTSGDPKPNILQTPSRVMSSSAHGNERRLGYMKLLDKKNQPKKYSGGEPVVTGRQKLITEEYKPTWSNQMSRVRKQFLIHPSVGTTDIQINLEIAFDDKSLKNSYQQPFEITMQTPYSSTEYQPSARTIKSHSTTPTSRPDSVLFKSRDLLSSLRQGSRLYNFLKPHSGTISCSFCGEYINIMQIFSHYQIHQQLIKSISPQKTLSTAQNPKSYNQSTMVGTQMSQFQQNLIESNPTEIKHNHLKAQATEGQGLIVQQLLSKSTQTKLRTARDSSTVQQSRRRFCRNRIVDWNIGSNRAYEAERTNLSKVSQVTDWQQRPRQEKRPI